MVKQRRIKVTVRGLRSFDKSVRAFSSKINNSTFEEYFEVMKKAKIKMIDKTSSFSPSTSMSGLGVAIHDSFILMSNRGDKTSNINLKNIAPHASAVEGGVREHFIYRHMSPKISEWMDINGIPKGLNKINVGGPHSNIKKGNSNRAFFTPVMDEMTQSGVYDKASKRALDDALEIFRKRGKK